MASGNRKEDNMDEYSWEVNAPGELEFIEWLMNDATLRLDRRSLRCQFGKRAIATVYGPDAYKVPVLLAQFHKDTADALHYQI
jgi:hypothetical protein